MALRFIVKFTALALGTTWMPIFSQSYNFSVRMASISGTMMSGLCFSTTAIKASPSSMWNTSHSSATCMAGACSYESQAITYCPLRLQAITNSFPSSPEPNNKIFFVMTIYYNQTKIVHGHIPRWRNLALPSGRFSVGSGRTPCGVPNRTFREVLEYSAASTRVLSAEYADGLRTAVCRPAPRHRLSY